MTEATTDDLPKRFLVEASLAEVAAMLPSIGRAMVGITAGGATHERIGVIETASCTETALEIGGALHDSRIDPSQIVRVVGDRSGGMRGKVFPRLEFQDAAEKTLLSVIAMEGLELYDAALRPRIGATLEPLPRPEMPPAAEAPATDAGNAALEALRASGGEVEIRLDEAGASQSWRGKVEEVKPAMGFANIIRSDFHLHLRDGAVTAFRRTDAGLAALDAQGAATGLVLRPLDAAAEEALASFG